MTGVLDRVRRLTEVAARVTVVPLLVRAGLFVAALGALAVAVPTPLIAGRLAGLFALAAALPALSPRGRGATLVVLLAVAGWLLDTTYYGRPVGLARLLALATLLYLVHVLAALAAVLPYDAVVAPEVVARWLARASAVVLATAVLTVAVLTLTGVSAGGTVLAASVLGLGVAVAAAALLTWLLRR